MVESAEAHLRDEIHPYVQGAWIDHTKTKVGFEIPFTRQFYVYTPPGGSQRSPSRSRTSRSRSKAG
jgi:hypothetical protein